MPLLNPIKKTIDMPTQDVSQMSIQKTKKGVKWLKSLIPFTILALLFIEAISFNQIKNGGTEVELALWGTAQTYAILQLFIVGILLVSKSFYFSTCNYTRVASVSFLAVQFINLLYLFTAMSWAVYSVSWFLAVLFGGALFSLLAIFNIIKNADINPIE